MPTIDVYLAPQQPEWATEDPRWERVDDGVVLLTVEEFFDFYSALPPAEIVDERPKDALVRLERWTKKHPELALREPVRMFMATLRKRAGIARVLPNNRMQLTAPRVGRAGNGGRDAAAACSPFGEHRRRS